MKKRGLLSNGLLWFGAAVSIAEIEAGTRIGGCWSALLAGHLLGGLMLFAVGLIGAQTGKNAMETTSAAFGVNGMRLLAALNIVQLAGWTAVMIAQGGAAAARLTGSPSAPPVLALAVVLGVSLFVTCGDRLHLASVAMGLLALLAVVLTARLVGVETAGTVAPLGFRTAFEISVAMPLSWLPLISDYTSTAARPKTATAVSAGVYTLVSLWMYALGMQIAGLGDGTLTDAVAVSGVGAVGLGVVVFSTVVSTFLDAYSSGESSRAVFPRAPVRVIGVAVAALGGALALAGIMDHYIGFLSCLSSVFAPMASVLVVDRYLVRLGRIRWNVCAWLAGVAAYHLAGFSPVGPTLTAVLVSAVLASTGGRIGKR